MASHPTRVPPVLVRLVRRFHVIHERVVLVTVLTEHVPVVAASQRWTVERMDDRLVRVILRYGFMEVPKVPDALAGALASAGTAVEKDSLLYVLGRETLIVTEAGRMDQITEPVFAFLARNARSVSHDFSIPVEQVVEVGMQLDL
jgi:KUP system potassium uptake protein